MNALIVDALKAVPPVWRRFRNWQILCDTWEAAEIHGRVEASDPMPGAGLTTISLLTPWSNSLVVRGYDINPDGSHREHEGKIMPDPHHPTGFRRTVRYLASAEVSYQRIEVLAPDRLLVIPDEPDYHRHILRRAKGSLFLN